MKKKNQVSLSPLICILVLFKILASMFLFSSSPLSSYYKNLSPNENGINGLEQEEKGEQVTLKTSWELVLDIIGHSNTSKMMACSPNLFIIPNYHGPFPVDYHFVLKPTDVIFDVSPAGYQPWKSHRTNLPNYFSFKYSDVTKYSLETINKTIHHPDIVLLKNHFKHHLLEKRVDFAIRGDRFIFLCNIPNCVTHVVMAFAFMDIYSLDFKHPCHVTEYKPSYMERYLIYDSENFKSSFQYMEWKTSSYKLFNYDPNFFKEEDLYFGESYNKLLEKQTSKDNNNSFVKSKNYNFKKSMEDFNEIKVKENTMMNCLD